MHEVIEFNKFNKFLNILFDGLHKNLIKIDNKFNVKNVGLGKEFYPYLKFHNLNFLSTVHWIVKMVLRKSPIKASWRHGSLAVIGGFNFFFQ